MNISAEIQDIYIYIDMYILVDPPFAGFPSKVQRLQLQELTFLEFFAGEGRVWKTVGAGANGKNSLGIDIQYHEDTPNKQNPFDILSNAGLA